MCVACALVHVSCNQVDQSLAEAELAGTGSTLPACRPFKLHFTQTRLLMIFGAQRVLGRGTSPAQASNSVASQSSVE